MKKGKTDWLIIVAVVVLGLVGGILIGYSSNLNEYMEGKAYDLRFDLRTTDFNSSSEVIYINGFVFYYDFTNNCGNIFFDLNNKNWSIDYIRIDFPSVIDENSLNIYINKNGDKLNVNLTKDYRNGLDPIMGHNNTVLILSDFNRTFYDETFVIDFRSEDFKPKGLFTFIGIDQNFIHAGSQNANVNFILGDHYECRGSCVYKLQNMEETDYSFDRDLQLNFKRKKANDTCAFQLDTVSRRILFWKSLLLGLGIALLAAAITFGLEVWYNSRRGKNG